MLWQPVPVFVSTIRSSIRLRNRGGRHPSLPAKPTSSFSHERVDRPQRDLSREPDQRVGRSCC